MNARTSLIMGAVFAAVAVAIGAFGAHALKEVLLENNRTDTFELAIRYQFYHAFALIFTGLLTRAFDTKLLRYAAVCFAGGIIFFSGSLLALSLSNERVLGAVTPIGGVLFLAGWILLITGLQRRF
jgi:uncharacterized membrane protein YgdD (TMEM256/DUF423 family)